KLAGYGVSGHVFEWIRHFLVDRAQRVSVAGTYSAWASVISGVPQGTVFGPVLFVCYINDMPENISSFIFMYADDTKIFTRADCEEDRKSLQKDLDQLVEWAEKWKLPFYFDKCKKMHMGGAKNVRQHYYMVRADNSEMTTLVETAVEKDLGVWMENNGKPSNHVAHLVSKANQLLGLIRRTFTYMDCALMKQLFTALIRPHLEYANVVWHPYLKKGIEMLEGVQHRATKMVPGLAKFSYEERLRRMDLPTLVYRRARGDAIEVFKYMNKIYKVNGPELLPLHETTSGVRTRGHALKLWKRECRSQLRSNFFSMRIVNMWNSLPESVVTATSVNCFKGRFD